MLRDPKILLGAGLSFPPRVGSDGRLAWSSGEDNIREAIQVVLKTEPGERLQLADFGGGLGSFLFEPNNPATHAAIEDRIKRSLQRWERRIQVEAVDVQAHPDDRSAALATLTYKLVSTQQRERVTLAVTLASS
jgi:phage baseplate assembly protein W